MRASHGLEMEQNIWRPRLSLNPPAVCATDINYGLLQLAVLLPLAEGTLTHCSSEPHTSHPSSEAAVAPEKDRINKSARERRNHQVSSLVNGQFENAHQVGSLHREMIIITADITVNTMWDTQVWERKRS